MTTSTHPADTSQDGGRIDTTRAAMQQALRLIEDEGHKADLLEAASILRAALAEQKCPCGDRPADQCPGEWEPGCDLGANEKYAKLAEQPQPVAWMVKDEGLYWTEEAAIRRAEQFAEPLDVVPLYTTPPAPQPLTIEKLRDALVASRVIDPGAVEDPDNYDDGVMFGRIEALFRRIA